MNVIVRYVALVMEGLLYLFEKIFRIPKCPECGEFIRTNAIYCQNCYSKMRWESAGI